MNDHRDESINKRQEYFALFAKKRHRFAPLRLARLSRAIAYTDVLPEKVVDVGMHSQHRAIYLLGDN